MGNAVERLFDSVLSKINDFADLDWPDNYLWKIVFSRLMKNNPSVTCWREWQATGCLEDLIQMKLKQSREGFDPVDSKH